MKKMLVAILILAIIVVLWFMEGGAVDRICSDMIENIEKLKVSEGEELDYMIEKTQQEWDRHEKVLEMFTPHEDTDQINVNWAAYKSRITDGNRMAAGYTLDEMSQRFKGIREKTKVSIQNIF